MSSFINTTATVADNMNRTIEQVMRHPPLRISNGDPLTMDTLLECVANEVVGASRSIPPLQHKQGNHPKPDTQCSVPEQVQNHAVVPEPKIESLESPEIIEVGIDEITVDEDFKEVLRPLTPEAFEMLKQDIAKNGIHDPLWCWEHEGRLDIVDGHNRREICLQLGITKVPIRRKVFQNKNDAMMWILHNQIMRRNLNTFQKAEAILKLNDFYAEKAKERQRAAGKDLTQNFGEGGEVNEALGKLIDSSPETIRKVKKILKHAVQDDIDALRKGEVSISRIYDKCTGKVAEDTVSTSTTKPKGGSEKKPKKQPAPVANTDGNPSSTEQGEQSVAWDNMSTKDKRRFVNDTLNDKVKGLPNKASRLQFATLVKEWADHKIDKLS